MPSQAPNDQAGVDRFLAAAEAESERLQAQIEAARARVRMATAATAGQVDAEAAFRGLFLAAQRDLESMEREHREVVESIRLAAAREAAHLLAVAREEAAAMRAASVAALTSALGIPEPGGHGLDADAARPADDVANGW